MPHIANISLDRLRAGSLSLGVGIRASRSVEVAKAMRVAGYDWLFLDLEHGVMSLESTAQIAAAAIDANITPIVRVPKGAYSMATRMLDNGALGVVMPHVESAAEAREVVQQLMMPPIGHRSFGGAAAALDHTMPSIREASVALNDATLIVVMLESPNAIANADEIAAVEHVDVVMIGSNDLAAEMGIPGEFEDPRMIDAYAQLVAACRRHGKFAGMGGIYQQPIMQRYVEMGVRFILSGSDSAFLQAGAASRASFLSAIALAPSLALTD